MRIWYDEAGMTGPAGAHGAPMFPALLRGPGFLLRPWRVEDARWYVESRDEEIFRWTEERRDLTLKDAEAGIRQANKDPNAVCLAIVDSTSGELLGNIALAFRENNRVSAEIMYWLAPQARGRGLATDAVKLLSAWAFEVLGLERLTLKTRRGNRRSEVVAERAGFRRGDSERESGAVGYCVWLKVAGPSLAGEEG